MTRRVRSKAAVSNYLENFTKEVEGEIDVIGRTRDLAGKNRQVDHENKKSTLVHWNDEITEELGYLNKYYLVDHYNTPGGGETVHEIYLVKNNLLVATLHPGDHHIDGLKIHA